MKRPNVAQQRARRLVADTLRDAVPGMTREQLDKVEGLLREWLYLATVERLHLEGGEALLQWTSRAALEAELL